MTERNFHHCTWRVLGSYWEQPNTLRFETVVGSQIVSETAQQNVTEDSIQLGVMEPTESVFEVAENGEESGEEVDLDVDSF